MNHYEYVYASLGGKVDYDSAFKYQCIDLVRKYASLFYEPIGTFGGNAITGRETGKPFNSNKKRIKVKNGPKLIPPQGAIIFYEKTAENKRDGHVAIVHIANEIRVSVLEQNAGKGSRTGIGTDAVRISTGDYLKPRVLGRYYYSA